jgi:GT2 family glycosyltransferase
MPTPKVAMLHTLYLFGLIKTNNLLNEYFLYNYTSEEAIEVESLTMSLMLARREVFENVGLLDENLFVWASDVDWCYNVKQTVWKQIFIPKAVAIHRRNSVSKKQPYKNLLYYHQDLKLFYKKHFSTQNGLIINTLWFIMLQVRFVLQTIRYIIKGGKDYSFY